MSRQWAVPIILGLLTSGLVWVAAPDELSLPRRSPLAEVRTDDPYVLAPSPHAPGHHATLLRYNATATTHGLGGMLDVHAGQYQNGTFWWGGNGWECLRPGAPACQGRSTVAVPLHPCAVAEAEPDQADAAREGPDTSAKAAEDAGDDPPDCVARPAPTWSREQPTVALTWYLFTSQGHLLATNAPRSQWDHFDLHGEFTRFSQTVYAMGEGEAPPGAARMPLFREQAAALLDGTPVGGVRSGVLERHPYDWLVGPVWATARVEPFE